MVNDPYGNMGAIPDAHWSEVWQRRTQAEIDDYFADIATWGPLDQGQCEQLIQGIPPYPRGWLPPNTCLAEFESRVKRLRFDMAQGVIPPNPTAAELEMWCRQRSSALPSALVAALGNLNPASASATPQTPLPALPIWIALPPASSVRRRIHRGRPKAQGIVSRNDVLVQRGIDILMDAARKGQIVRQVDVAKQLEKEPVGRGMPWRTIDRRLHGRLPRAQAIATAEQALARAQAEQAKSSP